MIALINYESALTCWSLDGATNFKMKALKHVVTEMSGCRNNWTEDLMDDRAPLVRHPFGTIKALQVLAYNVKRVIAIIGLPS